MILFLFLMENIGKDKLNDNYKKLNDYEIFKEPIVNNK